MPDHGPPAECVINISEGRDRHVIDAVAAAGGDRLLDVHTDPVHHRSVLTLAGDRICAMTRFENSVLPWFGLPRSLASR